MKVLLTGGAGFVGSHVLQKLRDNHIDTLVYDDLSSGHETFVQGNPMVRGDICDPAMLDQTIRDYQPDMVFHIAALATMSECTKRPDECHRVNVEGTQNILEAMKTHGIKHIVFASSCAVYANAKTLTPLRESDPTGPISPYAESKLDCEQLLKDYEEICGIRHVAYRIFNVSGAHPDAIIGECHDPETHLLPLVIDRMLGKRDTLYVFGDDYPTPDGTAIRDYVHVWDIAEAFYRAGKLLESGSPSHILNLGSGRPTSVYELIRQVKQMAGMDISYTLESRREGDSAWLFGDGSHLKEVLGWKPEWSDLPSIIRTALQWHQKP
jgi:UDP-glucose-4-epimerase GalE